MHVWPDFRRQVLEAHNSISFTRDFSVTDSPAGDFYFVGSERGKTTLFARHVCDAVSKAFVHGKSTVAVRGHTGDSPAPPDHPTLL
jgi:hypothetical protein